MEMKNSYDAIVIGSGIGGLTAAAVLTKVKHYRVLVLEQHFKLGGFTHTFQRPGDYHWDVGLHYVGEMNPGSPLRRAMDFITGHQVEWVKMKDPFEIFLYPGLRFEVPSGKKEYLQKLQHTFPKEARNLRRYFRDLDLAVQGISGPWMKSFFMRRHGVLFQRCRDLGHKLLSPYLDFRFQDDRLKALLASQWGDYGLPPEKASFGIHATIAQHYLEGGFYPKGSASSLVEAVAKGIREGGGELKIRNRVKRILLEGDHVVGVEVESRRGSQVIAASQIYSDAGAEATYGKLLPRARADFPELEEIASTPTYGAVLLYLGLKSKCEHLGIHGQNFWIYDDLIHNALWERRNQLAQGRASSCYLSFPGIKDPLARKPTAEIMAPLDYSVFHPWQGTAWMKRGTDYGFLKQKITDALLDFVEDRIPGFREEVVYAELSTPLSMESFTGHRDGAVYGFPGIPRRYDLKTLGPKTPIKGLSLVGADAGSLGITGAMMGGILGVASQHGLGILSPIFKAN
jgi:phytoene dehydrogenase-like protein